MCIDRSGFLSSPHCYQSGITFPIEWIILSSPQQSSFLATLPSCIVFPPSLRSCFFSLPRPPPLRWSTTRHQAFRQSRLKRLSVFECQLLPGAPMPAVPITHTVAAQSLRLHHRPPLMQRSNNSSSRPPPLKIKSPALAALTIRTVAAQSFRRKGHDHPRQQHWTKKNETSGVWWKSSPPPAGLVE